MQKTAIEEKIQIESSEKHTITQNNSNVEKIIPFTRIEVSITFTGNRPLFGINAIIEKIPAQAPRYI